MKDIKITKIKPPFTTVITTLDVYEEDLIVDGIVRVPKGSLKLYQKVVAVGPNVRDIKEGDLVLLNLQNYVKRKYRDNSIKEDISEMEEEYTFDIPKIIINDTLYGKFQERDMDGVIEEFEEIEVSNDGNPLLN
jgi:uncharacterized protein YeeX (DUF496 family)